MNIPQELKNYIHNKNKIDILIDELEKLKTRATKITITLSDMPRGSSSNDKLGNIVASIVDNANETARIIQQLENQENKIKYIIQKIEQPMQNAMYAKYINNKTVAEVSVYINYSYEQTKRILKKGNKIYEIMTRNDLE